MEAVERFESSGYKVSIYQDPDAQSPEDWDCEDIFLITTHNRYFDVQRAGFDMDSVRDGEYEKDFHAFPLIAYVHGSVALSLGREYPFNCQWDSGQIGYVLINKGAEFPDAAKAAQVLVEEWNQYLSGDVYGYVIEHNGEHVDSCWGFYGLDNCKQEALHWMCLGSLNHLESNTYEKEMQSKTG